MATVTNNIRTETITRVTGDVVLVLSPEEAAFLMRVTDRIGGCPWRSSRKYSDAIRGALQKSGIKSSEVGLEGSLRFLDP